MPTALVTGASSGIGLELASLLAAEQYNLVLTARSTDKLDALANTLRKRYGIQVTVITKDLSELDGAIDLWRTIEEQKIDIDLLVNNAGFGQAGYFTDADWLRDQKMLNVNVVALTALSKMAGRAMTKRRKGQILNIASVAAFMPMPGMAVYAATKAYVTSLSEALSAEFGGYGVSVTAFCPGPVATGFEKEAGLETSRLFRLMKPASASQTARLAYKAVRKGKVMVIPGFLNRLSIVCVSLLPRALVRAIMIRLSLPADHGNLP
jgi:short-subunit dehydrogenase